MEHASQVLMTSGRKRKRKGPEELTHSCSGKMSRTGEQYRCSLELLPEEMVVSIFSHLSFQNLLACRAVCKRFVRVIDTNFPLIAKVFCKEFAQPPDPTLFGKDRYKQVLRPWLEAFVTAQQRLTGGASGNLQFPDSKREETEKQASSEQSEQVQAIQSSKVEQLDRFINHKEFPKALFFILAKTLQNAESLYLQGKFSHFFCSNKVETVCFSPDGRSLLIPFGYAIRFMVLDGNDNVIGQNVKTYDSLVGKLRFSPNGRSLLISFRDSIKIMGLDGEDWVQKGEIRKDRFNHFHQPVCFSPDSDRLAAVFYHSVRIMGCDEKGNWVLNSEIPVSDAKTASFTTSGSLEIVSASAFQVMNRDEKGNWVHNFRIPFLPSQGMSTVCISPNGSSLAISSFNAVRIMVRNRKGNWVQNSGIPLSDVKAVCFSPDGSSLAILYCRKVIQHAILTMRSDEEGNWVQNFEISCDPDSRYSSVWFSPDGRNLMSEPFLSPVHSITGLDRANSRVYKYEPFLRNVEGDACAFSPDGGSLAIGCGSTTWVMGLDKGKWVKKACISNEGSVSPSPPWLAESSSLSCRPKASRGGKVSAVYFSPDSRRLAIISEYRISVCPRNSQVSVYEIKTGAKVLTDRDSRFLKGFFSS